MMTAFVFTIVVTIAVWWFLQQPQFGAMATGSRLEKIRQSPHFKNGQFQNLSNTPNLTEGATYLGVMKEFVFGEKVRNKPSDSIHAMKTDLLNTAPDENVLVWFGHSSYFMQLDGKRILVDPVFSGAASPLAFTTRSFPGTDVYSTDDFPAIDYLIITHDHWDHLDYETVIRMKEKVGVVICGLGVGAHLERWGYSADMIIEKDWYETVELDSGLTLHTAPARHFSGRGLKRNQSLWMSYVLESPSARIYIGGDSGYDSHYATIGERFGKIDLAILENGQYDKNWKYIHMMPEEVVQAAKDLNAARLLTVHNSKFSLGNHAWDEPLVRVTALAKQQGVDLITPAIGQKVDLKDTTFTYAHWWTELK